MRLVIIATLNFNSYNMCSLFSFIHVKTSDMVYKVVYLRIWHIAALRCVTLLVVLCELRFNHVIHLY